MVTLELWPMWPALLLLEVNVTAPMAVAPHMHFCSSASSLCGRDKTSEIALNVTWSQARSIGKEKLVACFNLMVLKCSTAIKHLKIKQKQSLSLVIQTH